MGFFDNHGQITSIITGGLIVMVAIVCYTVIIVHELHQ
jgi:hypothetical protein